MPLLGPTGGGLGASALTESVSAGAAGAGAEASSARITKLLLVLLGKNTETGRLLPAEEMAGATTKPAAAEAMLEVAISISLGFTRARLPHLSPPLPLYLWTSTWQLLDPCN